MIILYIALWLAGAFVVPLVVECCFILNGQELKDAGTPFWLTFVAYLILPVVVLFLVAP